MKRTRNVLLAFVLGLSLAAPAPAQSAGVATIRQVSVLESHGNSFELEIAGSHAITPQTRVLTGPDRLVVDFPGALPSRALHSVAVGHAGVQRVRVGLFQNNPPVTRVVLDLASPQRYQIFPSGRDVIVKIIAGEGASTPMMASAAASAPAPAPGPPPPPPSRLEVEFQNGKLQIVAQHATLAAVLAEVRRRTGAEINIPPGASSEQVFTDLGPAPARAVLASLLNGSSFNFIVIGSARDPNVLRSVLLTPRGPGGESVPAIVEQPTPQPAVAEVPQPPAPVSPPSADQQPSSEQDQSAGQEPPAEDQEPSTETPTPPPPTPESMSPPPPQ